MSTSKSEAKIRKPPKPWYKYKEQRVLVMVGTLTLIFCVAEIVFGIMVNSLALVSDAFHMLSDVLSLIVAFISIQLSRGAHTDNKTYGWVRAEVLGGLTNGVFLVAVCIFICLEAIQRFVQPEVVDNPLVIVYVGAGGLAVNLIGMVLFASHRSMGGHGGHSHGHSHGHAHSHGDKNKKNKEQKDNKEHKHKEKEHKHKETEHKHEEGESEHHEDPDHIDQEKEEEHTEKKGNANLHAIFLHFLGDALGSIGAIVTGIFIRFSTWDHRYYADPFLSIVFSLIILKGAVPLVKHCLYILMQSVPKNIDLSEIKSLLKNVDGVLSVHDLHVWQLSDSKHVATLHITIEHESDFPRISSLIQKIFHKHGVHSTTVQPEYVTLAGDEKPAVRCNVPCQSLSCRKDMCCDTEENLVAPLIDHY